MSRSASPRERRRRRSHEVPLALRYQLEACREDGRLAAMILCDDNGLCLAAAGAPETCEEIAARLPLLGRKTPSFEGVLFGGRAAHPVVARTIRVAGGDLYLCAVGGEAAARQELERSIGGVKRILGGA